MTDQGIETVDAFRTRAAAWIEDNLPRWDDELVDARDLQRLLFDSGFAGIAFPRAYGGAGLTLDHQKAFFDEAAAQDRQVPTGTIRVASATASVPRRAKRAPDSSRSWSTRSA